MRLLRQNLLSILLVLAGFAVVAALYDRMPDPVPTHWNLHGVADGFTHKPWGPLLLPSTMAGLLVVFVGIRVLSPKEAPVEGFARTYTLITAAVQGFLLLLTVVASMAAVGVPVDMSRGVALGVGMLYVVLGNFMGKFTRNFFVGIRTPWTLSSDEVWFRTHRLGGKLFVAAGLATLAGAFTRAGIAVLLASTLLATMISAVYSYLVYRQLETTR
jgi:uncharacterized membrane protein